MPPERRTWGRRRPHRHLPSDVRNVLRTSCRAFELRPPPPTSRQLHHSGARCSVADATTIVLHRRRFTEKPTTTESLPNTIPERYVGTRARRRRIPMSTAWCSLLPRPPPSPPNEPPGFCVRSAARTAAARTD